MRPGWSWHGRRHVGTYVEQQVHGVGAPSLDGEVQRPVPFLVLALDVHAAGPGEQRDHVAVALDRGHVERRQAVLVAAAEAGALAEEELEVPEVASPRRRHHQLPPLQDVHHLFLQSAKGTDVV